MHTQRHRKEDTEKGKKGGKKTPWMMDNVWINSQNVCYKLVCKGGGVRIGGRGTSYKVK